MNTRQKAMLWGMWFLDGITLLFAIFLMGYPPSINMRKVAVFQETRSPVFSIKCTPDNQTLLSLTEQGELIVWSLTDLHLKMKLDLKNSMLKTDPMQLKFEPLVISPDGHYAVVANFAGEFALIDLRNFQIKKRYQYPKNLSRKTLHKSDSEFSTPSLFGGVAFSPDGRLLAVLYLHGLARIYEMEEGQLLKEIPLSNVGRWLEFSHLSDQLLIQEGMYGEDVRVYETQHWGLSRTQRITGEEREEPKRITLSRKGRWLAVQTHWDELQLWEASLGHLERSLDRSPSVSPIDFSYNEKFVAAGSSEAEGVTVWETATGKKVAHLLAQRDWNFWYLWDFAYPRFLPGNKFLLVWTEEGVVRLYYLQNWRVGRYLKPEVAGEAYLSYEACKEGQWLAIGRSDGIVELWRFE